MTKKVALVLVAVIQASALQVALADSVTRECEYAIKVRVPGAAKGSEVPLINASYTSFGKCKDNSAGLCRGVAGRHAKKCFDAIASNRGVSLPSECAVVAESSL